MTHRKRPRWLKGVAVSGLAAAACLWIWNSARAWAQAAMDSDADYAGFIDSLLATLAGAVLMPVLLWAGMRALGERGNHLLVLLGTVSWLLIGGHVVEDDVSVAATVAFLGLFALLGSVLATVASGSSRREA